MSDAHGSPAVTASTASRLKSPAKTPRRTNIARASAPSRSMLHSTVAWIVRCRSGRSRAEVTSRGSTRSSRASIAAGVRARMRADASSIASGTPSSARQMRATSAALSAVTSNRGSAARARSRKSRTAGDSRMASTVACAGSGGTASGSTSNTCSPRTRSRARLVTRNVASGRSVRRVTMSGAASSTCSKLSSTIRSRRPALATPSCSESGRSPASRTPSSRAIAGSTSSGSRTCSSGTNVTRSNGGPAFRATSIARRLFPIPPGPTRVTRRCASSPSHVSSAVTSNSRPTASV